ncbi:MAG: hypothetical protein FWG64_03885 [Firmicutes bacterium]|nr:hypothetical protein [Bacillota bacterium]
MRIIPVMNGYINADKICVVNYQYDDEYDEDISFTMEDGNEEETYYKSKSEANFAYNILHEWLILPKPTVNDNAAYSNLYNDFDVYYKDRKEYLERNPKN